MNAKTFLSLGLTLFVSSAFAATTIEFPLTGVTYKHFKTKKPASVEVNIDVPKLNKILKKNGLDGLPTKIVITANSKPYWKVLTKRIDAATELMKKLEKDDRKELLFTINSGYLYEFPAMCYRGDTKEAVAVFDGMLGGFLTDEQGIQAIRYGKKKDIRSDFFKSDKALDEAYGEMDPEGVAAWKDYDDSSDSILIMSDLGAQGDGTELYSTYIEKCE